MAKKKKKCSHSDSKKPSYWGPKENGQFSDTHKGLLINIKPLKPKEVTITRDDLKTAFSDGFGIVDISYFDVIAKRLGL